MKNIKLSRFFLGGGGGALQSIQVQCQYFSTCCLYVGTPYTGQLKTFKYTRLNPYTKS